MDADPPNVGPAIQLKVRLLEASPMVWRRLLVPAAVSLRELHGIIQVAMGWEGIHLFQLHLRAVRYGSPELPANSPEATLASFGLRTGSRFIYEYDLNAPWRHEVRVERRVEPEAGKPCPLCLGGHGDCPAEDSGGPAGHLARQHDIGALVGGVAQQLLQARAIDVVLVTELSRWGRGTLDLLYTLKELEGRQVSVIALSGLQLDLATAHGRMLATVLAGIAEFERDLIGERIKSDLAAAKAWGRRLGRRPGQRPKSDRLAPKVLALVARGRSYRLIGRELGLSKNTVAEIVKRRRTGSTAAAEGAA